MNIYFACSLTGGREDENIYQIIVGHLIESGHQVPTAFLAESGIVTKEVESSAAEIYQRDTAWIKGCDALIAEASTPSHGVGYEIGYALSLGKPVLVIHHSDKRLSKMISGNPNPNLVVQCYESPSEALTLANQFLKDQRS
ncbi:MAG: nucleoside 2-deoxyribosyltransferase [Chloroflexota bacterium]